MGLSFVGNPWFVVTSQKTTGFIRLSSVFNKTEVGASTLLLISLSGTNKD